MTSNAMLGMVTPIGDERHGGPWTVAVPGGRLEIGVDTVGAGDPEEHTAAEMTALQDEADDGFPAFSLNVLNESPFAYRLRWRTVGDGAHPASDLDLGELGAYGVRVNGRLPSGERMTPAHAGAEILLWARQDHLAEGCEGFRIELVDVASGRPLTDRRGRAVIARGMIWDRCPLGEEVIPGCADGD